MSHRLFPSFFIIIFCFKYDVVSTNAMSVVLYKWKVYNNFCLTNNKMVYYQKRDHKNGRARNQKDAMYSYEAKIYQQRRKTERSLNETKLKVMWINVEKKNIEYKTRGKKHVLCFVVRCFLYIFFYSVPYFAVINRLWYTKCVCYMRYICYRSECILHDCIFSFSLLFYFVLLACIISHRLYLLFPTVVCFQWQTNGIPFFSSSLYSTVYAIQHRIRSFVHWINRMNIWRTNCMY